MSSEKNGDKTPPVINNYSEDQNAPITNSHGATNNGTRPVDSRHHRLIKNSSKQAKQCDSHPCDNIVTQMINKLSFQTTVNNIPVSHNNIHLVLICWLF